MARTTASGWAAASGACCETRTRREAKRSLAGSGSSWRTTLERSERSSAPRPTRKERVFDRPDPACPAASGRLGAADGPVLAATCGARSRLESERPARLAAGGRSTQEVAQAVRTQADFSRHTSQRELGRLPRQAVPKQRDRQGRDGQRLVPSESAGAH